MNKHQQCQNVHTPVRLLTLHGKDTGETRKLNQGMYGMQCWYENNTIVPSPTFAYFRDDIVCTCPEGHNYLDTKYDFTMDGEDSIIKIQYFCLPVNN